MFQPEDETKAVSSSDSREKYNPGQDLIKTGLHNFGAVRFAV
jgi:hypothetical protein